MQADWSVYSQLLLYIHVASYLRYILHIICAQFSLICGDLINQNQNTQYCVNKKTVHVTVFTPVPLHSQSSQSFLILSTESNLINLVPKPANNVPADKLKYSMNINIIQFNYIYGIYETHVPLLYLLNILAHWLPVVASRFATMFLNHSKTVPIGWTYFHRAALLLPMVVSKVT